jgi:hypothetical protein
MDRDLVEDFLISDKKTPPKDLVSSEALARSQVR